MRESPNLTINENKTKASCSSKVLLSIEMEWIATIEFSKKKLFLNFVEAVMKVDPLQTNLHTRCNSESHVVLQTGIFY